MKKIILIPLDERPCNYDFPQMLTDETEYEVVVPPRDILGKKKIPGDMDKIWVWLIDHVKNCHAAVISIDTLLYSGIVPSRLHFFEFEKLILRLNNVKKLKEINPNIKIYAFSLIMRNPKYSSSDEEPDYYETCGHEIHRYGVINHLIELGVASDEDIEELKNIHNTLKKEYLDDYLTRRKKNLEVNKRVVELAAEGIFDFVIIPQDDASLYGLTAKDQQVIRQRINDLNMNLKVYMYPDADAVANTLITRYINKSMDCIPLVYVKYASGTGQGVVPLYEDRIVSESIKYQVLAAGGLCVSSVAESDIVLLINIPSDNMKDHLSIVKYKEGLSPSIEYDACRNVVEIIEFAHYVIHSLGKKVVIGDIAYANGGDPLLFSMIKQKGLLYKLSGYAGWNTSSNSLGTCIPMGMIHDICGDSKAHLKFLALRYLEDIGFCVYVRRNVAKEAEALGMNYRKTDGQRGQAAQMVSEELKRFANDHLCIEGNKVVIEDCYLPWARMFEVGIRVNVIQ